MSSGRWHDACRNGREAWVRATITRGTIAIARSTWEIRMHEVDRASCPACALERDRANVKVMMIEIEIRKSVEVTNAVSITRRCCAMRRLISHRPVSRRMMLARFRGALMTEKIAYCAGTGMF